MTGKQNKILKLFILLLSPLVNQNGKGGSGGSSQTRTEPWAGQQPYFSDVMKKAQRLHEGGYYKTVPLTDEELSPEQLASIEKARSSKFPWVRDLIAQRHPTKQVWVEGEGGKLEYYPGQAIAGFQPEQEAAQQLAVGRSKDMGSIFESTANLATETPEYLQRTLRGDFLSPETNPRLTQLVERSLEESVPGIDSSAIASGRYGSGAWGTMRGRSMSDAVLGAYEPERARMFAAEQFAPQLQLQAAGMAPGLAQQEVGMLATVGAEKQAMEQALFDEARAKWGFEQMEPWQRLGMYSDLVSGDFGGTSYTSTSGGGK